MTTLAIRRAKLAPGVPVGESWEISDRTNDVSVIANGEIWASGKGVRSP